jgi:NTE family protein
MNQWYGPADGVFEGGGVKGIAFVGALSVAREYVTEWKSVAGTSAGAITAAMLAAGYEPEIIRGMLSGKGIPGVVKPVRLSDLPQRRALWGVPALSQAVNLFAHLGMYSGDLFYQVMEAALAGGPKGMKKFGELRASGDDIKHGHPPYRLQLIASDITHRRALVIPQDLEQLGFDPDEVPVALGVRMSMSIPLFFEPVVVGNTRPPTIIVDGGFLSNFPIWLFDSTQEAEWPTFGFLLDDGKEFKWNVRGVAQLVKRVIDTSMGALNDLLVARAGEGRLLRIDVSGYRSTQFNMSEGDIEILLERGRQAAKAFFSGFEPGEYHNLHGNRLSGTAMERVQ